MRLEEALTKHKIPLEHQNTSSVEGALDAAHEYIFSWYMGDDDLDEWWDALCMDLLAYSPAIPNQRSEYSGLEPSKE